MNPCVLHVAQTAEYGLGRFLADLLPDQAARGWHVVVAGPDLGLAGVEHRPWDATRHPGPSVPAEAARLAGIVRRLDPDVVHLHSSKAGLVGRLVLRGRRPTLFQPHAWSFLAVEGATRRAAVVWERAAARWAHAVVCCSEAERAQGERARIGARYAVVPNAVDLDRFTNGTRAAARARLELDDGPLAVCVGRLSRQKGQDVLLDAWREVVRRVPDARLVLVGDGPDRQALERRARLLDGVELVGRRPTADPWLLAADVVVQPSRYEGLSLAVLEAMAAGRSVVATDVEGMAEAIGPAGAVVPLDAPRALGRAVAERLLDRAMADEEGRRGRERAETRHALPQWQERMAELTLALLGERSRW